MLIGGPTSEGMPGLSLTGQPPPATEPATPLDRSAFFDSSGSSTEDQKNLFETSNLNASTSSISPPPTPDSLSEYANRYRQNSTSSISPPPTPDSLFEYASPYRQNSTSSISPPSTPNSFLQHPSQILQDESELPTIPWPSSTPKSDRCRTRTPSPSLPPPTRPRLSGTWVPSFVSSPGNSTIQQLLLSLENERLSEAFVPMSQFITLRNLRMALAGVISDNRVSELDNEVALFIRSLRCLGVAVCREILDIGFLGHSSSSSSSHPGLRN